MLPLLTIMLLTAPAGIALIWLAPHARWARGIAAATAATVLIVSLVILVLFDGSRATFQMTESLPWIPSLAVHYRVAVDGISVLFLPATALLFLAVIIVGWRTERSLVRLYFSLLLLLETATLGVFCAIDTMLFFLFWELTLAPLYFLVSLWGTGPQRRYAATKYTLVMLAGGVPLLFGLLLLAFNHAQVTGLGLSFDLRTLMETSVVPSTQYAIFVLLLFGFAVKTPLFPVHTWLPVTAMEGPTNITTLLVGLKLGAYGLLRYVLPLAPAASRELHWLLAALGSVAILYGAFAALAQTNLRRMLAYSSLSHVGLVVLGLSTLSLNGIQGAVLQLLNFVLVAGALMLLTASLQRRIGSTDILSLGGVARQAPLLSAFFLLFGLAAMGFPGTSGFPAELLIIVSAIREHTGAGLVALAGMIVGGAYFLGLYARAFLGPVRNPAEQHTTDLGAHELAVVALFALIILGVGFYPGPVLELLRPSAQTWLGYVGR